MHEDDIAEGLRSLWQQTTSSSPSTWSPDTLRAQANRLHNNVRARNRRESIAGVIVLVVYTAFAFVPGPPLMRTGAVLSAGGAAFILWYIHRHAGPRPLPATPEACLNHYRKELEHQRDLLRRVWLWYLGPLTPGALLWMIAFEDITAALLFTLVFGGIGALNQLAARTIQKELDSLPPTEEEGPS